MKKKIQLKSMTYAAMFLALAFVMPFFTGQIPQIGAMLCPMHIPVLLCGYVCGPFWGGVVGFFAPLLRSILIGMPTMYPKAVCMAFELTAYGFFAGILNRILPAKKWAVYFSLILSMIAGRVVWGTAMFICLGFDSVQFGMEAFIAGAVTNAVPGIILQIIVIPVLVMVIKKVTE